MRADLEVFELHGVAVRRKTSDGGDLEPRNVVVCERPDGVCVAAPLSEVTMAPEEARRLARSLYRCARRVDARKDTTHD